MNFRILRQARTFLIMVEFRFFDSLLVIFLFLMLIGSCHTDEINEASESKWWTEADRRHILSELKRTTKEVVTEITNLSTDQWNFRAGPSHWTIGEIVEHLEMQNQLHYREISVTSNAPQYLQFSVITKGRDDYFSSYATDTVRSDAKWFLEPLGRFHSVEMGKDAFVRARLHLSQFVSTSQIDLRKQFTFRRPVHGTAVVDLKIGQVRDLHQLLLTGIAHTDRHIHQIKSIKQLKAFPL